MADAITEKVNEVADKVEAALAENLCLGKDTFACNADDITLVSLGIAAGALSLLFVVFLIKKLQQAPRGNDLMNKICDEIKKGANAFINTEYFYLSFFVGAIAILLVILYTLSPTSGFKTDGVRYGGAFVVGAVLSALSGWGGMKVATDANVRTTQAADAEGLSVALRVAFTGGAVMGFTVVGLALFGVSIMFYILSLGYEGVDADEKLVFAADALTGFGFGASSIALFARSSS